MSEIRSDRRMSRLEALRRYPIDGQAVKKLTMAGLQWLDTNKQTVNALNVFPVPDGDTGTNMVLTMKSAIEEIEHSAERSAGKMLHEVAQGALMGARGNSGVILSQLWRGFARALDGQDAFTGKGLAAGFIEARDTAYKGVVRPVEGTILTVAKDVAQAVEKQSRLTDDVAELLETALKAAGESVEHTPELLPILKEAGVVDSGGKGLFYLLEGMVRWIYGEPLDTPTGGVEALSALDFEHTMESVEEGQDYEVVVDFRPNGALDIEEYYSKLEEMGTSIQLGEGDGMYRMHIHVPTEKRYEPIDYTMQLGTVTNVAIENLMAQMQEIGDRAPHARLQLTPVSADQIAVIAVAPGDGIARVFASLGVAGIVEGGQTMNPSTQQIMAAFENLPTNEVIILPNNKNIVMAAEAAAELTVKEVKVIPSKTVPQGLAAMLRLNPDGDFDAVFKDMLSALDDVQTGEITTATRNAEIDGVKVKEGQILGLHNGKLIYCSPNLEKTSLGLLNKIGMDDYELITLFYGAGMPSSEVEAIAEAIRKSYPEHEIEVQDGGQEHYQFILSIE